LIFVSRWKEFEIERIGGKAIDLIRSGKGDGQVQIVRLWLAGNDIGIPRRTVNAGEAGGCQSDVGGGSRGEDCMDMAVFEDRYENEETVRLAYDSKVVLMEDTGGLVLSRKMEEACRKK
jgi:hypothetical protein